MKSSVTFKSLFPVFFLVVTVTVVSAQESMDVTEVNRSMSKGSRPGYSITIPQSRLKDVISAWRKNLKQSGKKPVNEESGEWIMQGAVIPQIGTDTVSVYSVITETDNGINLLAFFAERDSVFYLASSSSVKDVSARRFVHDFGVQQYKLAVEDELKDANKKLSEYEENLEDLDHSNEKDHKKINEINRTIDRLRSDISTNEKEQGMKVDEILKQKQILNSFQGSPDERNAEEKKLKDLEKQKKKMISQNESMHKDIDDHESDIRDLQRHIDKTTSELIPKKRDEITSQKDKVKSITAKYNNIH